MFPFLVADIGGTNARFALVTGKSNGQFVFDHIQVLPTQDHPTFESAFQAYLDCAPQKPTAACIAIAGPVNGDHIKMTNLSWEFTGVELSRTFGLTKTLLMNDFAAVAAACSQMTAEHLETVKPGTPNPTGNKAVYGPGTGLGVAGLVNANGQWLPVPAEGGHVNIAPANAYEAEVIKAAMAEHGHVSAETFISGPGLVNLYKAVCSVENAAAKDYEPADVSQKGVSGEDTLCAKALELFVSFAGSFAGNLALTYGATGGNLY